MNPKFDTSGWYAQAGFFLKPEKWEIAARYAKQDPSDLVGPDKITEIRGGLNFFYARHALKVQADYGADEDREPRAGTARTTSCASRPSSSSRGGAAGGDREAPPRLPGQLTRN